MFSFLKTRAAATVAGVAFPYPVSPCPPIAVFTRAYSGAIVLNDPGELHGSGAQTVAASLADLRAIDATLWQPQYGIVVLSHVDSGLITDDDRDWLWIKYRVPVFEYLVSGPGQILGLECEAHEGLHLSPSAGSEVKGLILRELCPCGKSGPRLLELDVIIEKSAAVSTLKQEWRNWQTHQT